MVTLNWQLQTPLDAILFDCDGTLSTIEGIDELAEKNGIGTKVSALTADAMGKSGLNPILYQQRLDLVRPTQSQVVALGKNYFQHRTEDANEVIQLLQHLGKKIYIISAGLLPAVSIFAELLKVPQQNVFAVSIQFDEKGNFLDFDHTSPLITNHGKHAITDQIKQQYPKIAFIGDGLNDYSVYDLVTRFIGYGGVFYRKNIEDNCDYYIKTTSLTAMLPFVLTQEEQNKLNKMEFGLYQKGFATINNK